MFRRAYSRETFKSRDVNVIIYALKISFIVIHPASFMPFLCVLKYGQGEINYVSNNSKSKIVK